MTFPHLSARTLATLSTALLFGAALLEGCGGIDDDNDPTTDGTTEVGVSCEIVDDCANIACLCDDGSSLGVPVNARNCTNGACETSVQACPGSCGAFGYPWTGDVVANNAIDNEQSRDGDAYPSCAGSADCAPHVCFCPDGSSPEFRDCWNGICQDVDQCADECCATDHGC
jgi:hypothetical protein